MAWYDIITGTNPAASVVQGAVQGVLSKVGGAADSLYSYVTGNLPPEKQAEFDFKFAEFKQEINKGQLSINLAEANSGSNFRGGWRPALGWVCALSLGAYYIPQALAGAILWVVQCSYVMVDAKDIGKVVLPSYPIAFNVGEIMGLVASLLGMAGLRSYDKKNSSECK